MTLVTRDDTRLTGEIEKLLKKKIDLEPFDLEDDRPRRRREERDEDERRVEDRSPAHTTGRESYQERRSDRPSRTSAARASDPFFDKPYEPSAADHKPSWESEAAAKPSAGQSRNIKPRRRVAALLGGAASAAAKP